MPFVEKWFFFAKWIKVHILYRTKVWQGKLVLAPQVLALKKTNHKILSLPKAH